MMKRFLLQLSVAILCFGGVMGCASFGRVKDKRVMEIWHNPSDGMHVEYQVVDDWVHSEWKVRDRSGNWHFKPGGALTSKDLSRREMATFWSKIDGLGMASWQRFYETTGVRIRSGAAEWRVYASDCVSAGDGLYPALEPAGEPTRAAVNGFSELIRILEEALADGA